MALEEWATHVARSQKYLFLFAMTDQMTSDMQMMNHDPPMATVGGKIMRYQSVATRETTTTRRKRRIFSQVHGYVRVTVVVE